MVTTDEETGGLEGVKVIAEKGFSPQVLIVPDGGEDLNFVDKAKGVCQIKLVAKGKPAHASRIWLGKNAIDSLVLLGAELLKIYGKNNLKESWATTMNFGTINGGISTNQVCPEAEMKIDFRYPETDSIENIISVVEGEIKELGLVIEVSTLSTGLPTFTDVNDTEVVKYI
jgi:acetylornithine deacetylase/succinyl-diaminopimelate desuccinylase-like protein